MMDVSKQYDLYVLTGFKIQK